MASAGPAPLAPGIPLCLFSVVACAASDTTAANSAHFLEHMAVARATKGGGVVILGDALPRKLIQETDLLFRMGPQVMGVGDKGIGGERRV